MPFKPSLQFKTQKYQSKPKKGPKKTRSQSRRFSKRTKPSLIKSTLNLDKAINDFQMMSSQFLQQIKKDEATSAQMPHSSKLELLLHQGQSLCAQF